MTTSTKITGTGANLTGIGSNAWTLPNRIQADDGTASNAVCPSNYLKATNFGFAIPSNATVEGIVVNVDRSSSQVNTVTETEVKLLKAGTIVGNNAATSNYWPTSLTVASYGSSSGLWGTTWSYSDINDTNFGVVLATVSSPTGKTAYVDYVSITVYYSVLVYLASSITQTPGVTPALTRERRFATSIVQVPSVSVNLSAYANFVAAISQAASIVSKLKVTQNFQAEISQAASVSPTMLIRVRIAAAISQSATVSSVLRVGIRIKSALSQVTSIIARLLISWSQVQPHSATWTNKSSSNNSWTNK
jgi:hypothetical protein